MQQPNSSRLSATVTNLNIVRKTFSQRGVRSSRPLLQRKARQVKVLCLELLWSQRLESLALQTPIEVWQQLPEPMWLVKQIKPCPCAIRRWRNHLTTVKETCTWVNNTNQHRSRPHHTSVISHSFPNLSTSRRASWVRESKSYPTRRVTYHRRKRRRTITRRKHSV